jgi:hypothetical protein
MLEIRGNMGQCKSKDPDFKSYANAVFRRGCCCLSASLSTKTLKGTWDSASLRAKTLRDYAKEKLRENMGQCESKERGFKE